MPKKGVWEDNLRARRYRKEQGAKNKKAKKAKKGIDKGQAEWYNNKAVHLAARTLKIKQHETKKPVITLREAKASERKDYETQ